MEVSSSVTVYGGSGFVGSHFCENYSGEVIIVPRNVTIPSTNNILYLISTVDNYNVKSNPYLDIDTNLTQLIKTLESCREAFGNDFVFNFVSSWFVYGQNGEWICSEDSYCNPTGFYSITKRAAEQLLISYCTTYNIPYRILRLANVMGPGDKKSSLKKNAVQFLIGEIVKGNDVNVYIPGSIRDYIHVDDCAKAIELCTCIGKLNTIYNIGNGVECDTSEMLYYAHKYANGSGKLNEIEVPEFHRLVQSQDIRLDVSALFGLGYIPNYSSNEIVEELVDFYKLGLE